jgi:proteasome accessory factor B
MARIHEIHAAILKGNYPNCTTLAKKLGFERKTIQRDISFMRDALRLPIVYDDDQHGYRYAREVVDFPVFKTTPEELASMFLARNALRGFSGTRYADVLGQAFAKLTAGMLDEVKFSWTDLDEAFSRKSVEQSPVQVKLFGTLAKAILDRREIRFSYLKLGARKRAIRTVHPLHLGEVDGGWYLIAHDVDRMGLRTFSLPRIADLRVLSTRFKRPTGFVGGDYLRRSFGIWNVAGDHARHVVRVELKGYAARLAQERRWHPSQEVIPLTLNGSRVEIRFEVGRLEDVMRWVLSFGSQAKVTAPEALRKMIRKECRAMAR